MGLKDIATGLGLISGEPDPAALEDLHATALKVQNEAVGIEGSVTYKDPAIDEGHKIGVAQRVNRIFEIHELDVNSCSVAEQLARETGGVISSAADVVDASGDRMDARMTDVFRQNVIEFREATEALSGTCDMSFVNWSVDRALTTELGG